jgi:hypothetical protein
MLDTLDMLEAIGSDASLRHAQADALTATLEQLQASPALTSAVATGDSSELVAEFGSKEMSTPQISQI